MRLRIVFRLLNKGANIPFHHQQLLTTFIKKVLSDASIDHEAYEYNFSGLKGQTKISRSGLHYMSRRVTLVFAALDESFLKRFLRQLFKYDIINIGNLILIPETVEQEQKPALSEVSKFVCISPLVILNGEDGFRNKMFFHPSTQQFSDFVFGETKKRMSGISGYAEVSDQVFENVQIVPDRKYLNKIYKEEKKFARIYSTKYNDKYAEIRGYTFPFSLYAPVELQEFVFTCGFGALTKNGFGMLDLAYSDPNTRTDEYLFEE